ncbi:unnamed protein product [Closterium sp. Naga37s-1]|nr:unnamed protein product [Closterium sp. Naga37s-1]
MRHAIAVRRGMFRKPGAFRLSPVQRGVATFSQRRTATRGAGRAERTPAAASGGTAAGAEGRGFGGARTDGEEEWGGEGESEGMVGKGRGGEDCSGAITSRGEDMDMGDGSDGVGSPEGRRRQQSEASKEWRSRRKGSGTGGRERGSNGERKGEGTGEGSGEEMLVPSAAVLLLQGLTVEARWRLLVQCTDALVAEASAIDSKARQLSQQDWSTYCTDVIGRAVLTSARRWQQQLVGGSGRRREERGGGVAAGESGGAAAVGDAAGGSGGGREGVRGGGSEAEGVAVGEWQGREWWVRGEAVRGAVEDGRWALYCHLLAHLRFTPHEGADSCMVHVVLDWSGCLRGGDGRGSTDGDCGYGRGSTRGSVSYSLLPPIIPFRPRPTPHPVSPLHPRSRIAQVVLDDLVVEMAEAVLLTVIEAAGTQESRQWMGLSLPGPDSLDFVDSLDLVEGGYSGGSRGTGMVGLRESQGGIGGWDVEGEGLSVVGQGRGNSSRGGVSMGDVLSLFREEYRSSRRFEKFRNEVSLRKWLRCNVTSVVAIFEDRFLLWGLRRSSPPPALPTAHLTPAAAAWSSPEPTTPSLSQQQQHAPQLPPVSFPNDFSSASSTSAGAPLAWLQGLLRRGSASSVGGAGTGGSGMGTASDTRQWWQGKRRQSRVGERGQQGRVGGPVGLVRCSVVGSRRGELRQLRGWKLLVVVALELSDLLIPLFKAAITAAGRAVSFLLVALIGRSLGLVYRGIRQSWGQAL